MTDILDFPIHVVKRNIDKKEALNRFCDHIAVSKTPSDIFEKVEITTFDSMYLPAYLFSVDFNWEWEAEIALTDSNGKVISDYIPDFKQGSDGCFVFCEAKNDSMDAPHNFYPKQDDITSLIDDSCDINSNEILVPLMLSASISSSSKDVLNSNKTHSIISDMIDIFISSYIRKYYQPSDGKKYSFYFSNKYQNDFHVNKGVKIDVTDITTHACFVPIYLVLYRYNGKEYRALINGWGGKKSLLSNNATYGEIPVDTKKTKGLFAKISAKRAKTEIKKESRAKIEAQWLNKINAL